MRNLNLSLIVIAVLFAVSCGKNTPSGELVGVQERPKWDGINPFGMVYVPSGSTNLGQTDQDFFNTHVQRTQTVSIAGFYMDDTEITNNEYRQFVYWVRDSLAHAALGHFQESEDGTSELIDWEQEIDWEDETLADMNFAGADAFKGIQELDTRKFIYEWEWKDWQLAAHSKGIKRSNIIHKEKTNVYPDTLCWIRDFTYSYNEPLTRNYFSHPAFDDYPVVGINWNQARAFCYWRTLLWNSFKAEDEPNSEEFRLPLESEWEWASRGGNEIAMYPWGSYYLRNAKGCLLANFKPGRGNYPEDGGMHTVKADAYFPNEYGLYNMSGNVAEWTETAYHDNARNFVHDLNPDVKYDAKPEDPEAYKRKVIRGGSWKDVGYYLQCGTRNWEFQDTNKSYIGFRTVLTFLGRSANDFSTN
ncbi:MAG: SUMF1/EgtB/PvdO family nonheme iron enzyme [Saprospiraceae bacterium]|nr:SUMF1/EgtB/PvdO family nonheme iron enzyme [Saprospiraceae bacterium]MBK7810662.1 SUMF1/EgtB/PvdO family nonheme iron enzyme [Saprospiraceae bacterium]MBK9631452.1 SUMF1/EgtB/PvdO family nonheme iron enzyme [Saprospiraceae bacterium]